MLTVDISLPEIEELHKLVAASRALDLGESDKPFDAATTEHVYWKALKHLRDTSSPRVRTRVVVDVIAGT